MNVVFFLFNNILGGIKEEGLRGKEESVPWITDVITNRTPKG